MSLVNIVRLTASLQSAGLPVVGLAQVAAQHPTGSPATFHVRAGQPGLVRVDWSVAPSPLQQSQAGAVIDAYDDTTTLEEKLDGRDLPSRQARVQAAMVLRASSQWADLSAGNKARIMAVIDAAATNIVAALTS